jgi:hypothetical protein
MASKIAGYVFDRSRRPIAKVKISLKGKVVAESGWDGSFSVALAKAELRVALTFDVEGYVSNTRIYDARVGGSRVVVMWPIAYRVTFNPGRDLDVELGASRIRIPANALTGRDGKKYNDPATLRFTWFDVTSPLQRAAAPGDFSGRLLDRGVQRLNSYGIFDLDVRDPKGRPLTPARGAKIGLAIAVPPKLADKAPKQTGFFNFDAAAGLWTQIDNFVFAPNTLTYNGSVTSFGGAHNLDDPQDTTCVTVRVVSSWDSTPMPNFSVTAQGLQYDSFGTTDSDGFVCLLVQRNASFTAHASGQYGGSDYGTMDPYPTFTSPDFSSGAAACGDPERCPFVGTIHVDLVVGMREFQHW